MHSKLIFLFAALLVFCFEAGLAKPPKGLKPSAAHELANAGVTQYSGMFTPALSEDAGGGWTKYTFDTEGGEGPTCVAGTPFTAFSKAQNPAKVLIFLQGGGACWQDFYFCNILADEAPPAPGFGIWADNPDNPVGDWSVVYLSYCDGSVFTGDGDVVDANFPFGPVRFHRGLRNVSAGIDLAKDLFPRASRILVAGSSAGGAGASANAAFLARLAYGNNKQVMVFNDAGPNYSDLTDGFGLFFRALDWDFGKLYPASCTACDDMGQGTEIIKWRLANDLTIREAWSGTDGDDVLRFFLNPLRAFLGDQLTQEEFRTITLDNLDPIHATYPRRYRRFIRSGTDTHTALQSPELYSAEANGVPLHEWVDDFLVPRPFWIDIVEDFVPLP